MNKEKINFMNLRNSRIPNRNMFKIIHDVQLNANKRVENRPTASFYNSSIYPAQKS